MSKVQKKSFQLNYELSERHIINLGFKKVHVGFLSIEGFAYCDTNQSILDIDEKFSVDIDFVKWNGVDIKPVLSCLSPDALEKIEAAALRHATTLFFTENIEEVA